MQTMRVRLTGYVRRDGARHVPGSILSLPEREARRLVRLGVAEALAEEPKPTVPPAPLASQVPNPPVPQTPPATEGPEFIAALTEAEVADALEFIQNSTFIRRVIEIEQAKPDPRAAVIEAAQRRLAALAGGE